jgi:hypothetical protein
VIKRRYSQTKEINDRTLASLVASIAAIDDQAVNPAGNQRWEDYSRKRAA